MSTVEVIQDKAMGRAGLQGVRNRAFAYAEEVTDPIWRRAYERLADAADTLDAMIARTESQEEPESD